MRAFSFVLVATALVACSSSPNGTDAATATDVGSSTYPAGPYGTAVGDTMADFSIQGYALSPTSTDPTGMSVVPIRLSDVRATPGCSCLIVLFNSELSWCPPCNLVMADYASFLSSTPAVCSLEVVLGGPVAPPDSGPTDGGVAPSYPTMAELDTAARASSHTYPIGMDNAASDTALGPPDAVPTFFVLDPATMRIRAIQVGSDPALGTVLAHDCTL